MVTLLVIPIIAIGLALLMGFELPRNFNSPYKATSCGDFWKRWHISLSTWLKDYLYIPLGGNRTGSWASVTIALALVSVALIGSWKPLFLAYRGNIAPRRYPLGNEE